jgi:hypothetical protein
LVQRKAGIVNAKPGLAIQADRNNSFVHEFADLDQDVGAWTKLVAIRVVLTRIVRVFSLDASLAMRSV